MSVTGVKKQKPRGLRNYQGHIRRVKTRSPDSKPSPLSVVSIDSARSASVSSCPLHAHCSGKHSEAIIPDLDPDSEFAGLRLGLGICMLASEHTPDTQWEVRKQDDLSSRAVWSWK